MEQRSQTEAIPAAYCMKKGVKTREKGSNKFELIIDEFIIQKGEFVAIVGQSGCGKSTLLDILGLALSVSKADEFTIYNHQHEKSYHIINSMESELADIRKSHIGYVLQTGGLLPFLTVEQNILLPRKINGMDARREHAESLAEKLEIEGQLNKKPQFLSGGQRQRAAIARALSHHPPIVLADEPTAAVDQITAEKIMKAFRNLTDEMGVTLLMVTHDTRLVKNIATRFFTFKIEPVSDQYIISHCYEKLCETSSSERLSCKNSGTEEETDA
jgi:putative ABC transport system ATP-binding protein